MGTARAIRRKQQRELARLNAEGQAGIASLHENAITAEAITQGTLEKIKREYRVHQAQMEASMLNQAMAIIFWVLYDKYGVSHDQLVAIINEVVEIAVAMDEQRENPKETNRLTIYNIIDQLREEAEIAIAKPNTPLPLIFGGRCLAEDAIGNIAWLKGKENGDKGNNTQESPAFRRGEYVKEK